MLAQFTFIDDVVINPEAIGGDSQQVIRMQLRSDQVGGYDIFVGETFNKFN